MDGVKKWFQSETVWSDIVTIVMMIVSFVDANFMHGTIALNPGYQAFIAFLAALGIHGRVTAKDKLS